VLPATVAVSTCPRPCQRQPLSLCREARSVWHGPRFMVQRLPVQGLRGARCVSVDYATRASYLGIIADMPDIMASSIETTMMSTGIITMAKRVMRHPNIHQARLRRLPSVACCWAKRCSIRASVSAGFGGSSGGSLIRHLVAVFTVGTRFLASS